MAPTVDEAISRIDRWLENTSGVSCDPYDALNSPVVRTLSLGRPLLRRLATQAVKLSPVDLRRLLLIKPEKSAYAAGLLASSYSRLVQTSGRDSWSAKMYEWLDWLTVNRCPDYPEHCWPYHFDVQTRVFFYPRTMPNLIATSFAASGFLDAFGVSRNPDLIEAAKSTCDFIVDKLPRYREGNLFCFGYLPISNKPIHNANLLAAAVLARVGQSLEDLSLVDLSLQACEYTLKHQNDDGSWFYAGSADLRWVDGFHTGFVLSSLFHVWKATDDMRVLLSLKRGLRFYRDTMFGQDGRPYYYPGTDLPIDILCAAQGVETLALLSEIDSDSLPVAESIATWTLQNMWHQDGHFDFQLRRRYRISTPYIRWSIAPMLSALTQLIIAKGRTEAQMAPSVALHENLD